MPVYRCDSSGRIRFAISHYRDGKRLRQSFTTLNAAKKEALFVAQRIQAGMQHVTDLKPHERDNLKAAEAMLQKTGIPLVAAVTDYLRARELAGTESLAAMASEYGKVFFSFARSRNYLPEDKSTAADNVRLVKSGSDDVTVFTPQTLATILHAAPPRLIPILAIGAFSGIRMAELNRLDWSAVDLDRRIIEIRAGQAKTASRRVVSITDNLAAWLGPLPRKGKVVGAKQHHRDVSALAEALGINWPRNVLT